MKKAIVVVSFGTSYPAALQASIESIENKIRDTFPEYEVRRAFTSRIVRKKIAERDGIHIDTEREALEKLQAEGYQEVYIQPLHVIVGEEYDKVKVLVAHYAYAKVFEQIKLGRPLLYFMGQAGKPDDYLAAIEAIKGQLPKLGAQEAVVFMGHGGMHPANTAYAALQMKMEEAELERVFIYTIEAYPSLENIIKKLQKQGIRKVTLMPFMLVAGDHVHHDMVDDEHSAQTRLIRAGFEVDIYFHALGENTKVQDLYVQHLRDVIEPS